MTVWSQREERVYRELRELLEERSPEAGRRERELLDAVRDTVANMEAALARTVGELEALREEDVVFRPDEHHQRFRYAGTFVHVLNQSNRLIVDLADARYLGESYDVEMHNLERCYTLLRYGDMTRQQERLYREAVDQVMHRQGVAPAPAMDGREMERHLDAALTEAGYTRAYLYGPAEERLDDVLELARTPLEDRPTERDGYTVRIGDR